jgi:thiol-disulfide isomerase/thioredoxin
MMLIAGPRMLLRCLPATLAFAACACGQAAAPPAPPAPPAAVAPPATPSPSAPAVAARAPNPPAPPAEALDVGDQAPSLANVSWLQGDKVSEFKSGTVYVVEFWAPWCPDCRAALSVYANLAQHYAGKSSVQLLAVAVWPKRAAPEMAKDFVEDASDLFPYPVAEDVDNATAKAWLESASVSIPTAVVVGADGRIAWIGDPREGLTDAVAEALGEAARVAKLYSGRKDYQADVDLANAAERSGSWKSAAELTLSLYEKAPTQLYEMSPAHYVALVMMGDKDGAKAWGERMLTKDFVNLPLALNLMAWRMVEPMGTIPLNMVDLDLALRLSKRADDLTWHSNAYILDTLARVRFLRHELPDALRTQLTAVEAAAKIDPRMDKMAPALRKDLAERLAAYTQAADEADDDTSASPQHP